MEKSQGFESEQGEPIFVSSLMGGFNRRLLAVLVLLMSFTGCADPNAPARKVKEAAEYCLKAKIPSYSSRVCVPGEIEELTKELSEKCPDSLGDMDKVFELQDCPKCPPKVTAREIVTAVLNKECTDITRK